MSKLSMKVVVFTVALLAALPALAQMPEVTEKPRMYSYVAEWAVPRAQWGEVAKSNDSDDKVMQKAQADGKIIAFGNDRNLMHQPDGYTHDNWFSSMSLGGLLQTLDELSKGADAPVILATTKHEDNILVSRYYGWKPGTYKDAYTSGSQYELKKDAPDNLIDDLAKHLVVPLMEKLLADGLIVEYEIDVEAYHTTSPEKFWIFDITTSAENIDKINAIRRDRMKDSPLGHIAFGTNMDDKGHRDFLMHTNCTYK